MIESTAAVCRLNLFFYLMFWKCAPNLVFTLNFWGPQESGGAKL